MRGRFPDSPTRPACFHRASNPASFDKDDSVYRLLLFSIMLAAQAAASKCESSSSNANAGNVLPVVVNAGPTNSALNQLFATVTICVPGTSNCQTISGILVDTGSVGLRVLSSVLTQSLPQQTGAGGAPVVECLPF